MENQRRPRGRPKIYNEDQLQEHRTRYMLNTCWHCRVCERWYSLAGKHSHLATKNILTILLIILKLLMGYDNISTGSN